MIKYFDFDSPISQWLNHELSRIRNRMRLSAGLELPPLIPVIVSSCRLGLRKSYSVACADIPRRTISIDGPAYRLRASTVPSGQQAESLRGTLLHEILHILVDSQKDHHGRMFYLHCTMVSEIFGYLPPRNKQATRHWPHGHGAGSYSISLPRKRRETAAPLAIAALSIQKSAMRRCRVKRNSAGTHQSVTNNAGAPPPTQGQ